MIECMEDLLEYLAAAPLRGIAWYGPRASDALGLLRLLDLRGVIACYGTDGIRDTARHLVSESPRRRSTCSVDRLATTVIRDGRLDEFVSTNSVTSILPYDTTPDLEDYCARRGIRCLSSADSLKVNLGDKTKIDQISTDVGLPPIPGVTGIIDKMEFDPLARQFGLPLFLHFSGGSGGNSNFIVHTHEEFAVVKDRMRGRRLNAKAYYEGRSCSIDICVTPKSVLCGPLEEMIIGAPPLNANPTQYVGSSWFDEGYSSSVRRKLQRIGVALGQLMRSKGYIGFFHPDFLIQGDDVRLTELNMRFGGSCGVYTRAQTERNQVPLMLAHIIAFLDRDAEFASEDINERNAIPIPVAAMSLANNTARNVMVSSTMRSGLYRYRDDGKLQIITGGYTGGVLSPNEVFIAAAPMGAGLAQIEPGALICEITTGFQISDGNSKLNREGLRLIDQLTQEIHPADCDSSK